MTRTLPHPQTTDVVSLTLQVDGEALPGTVVVRSVEVVHQVNRIPYARLRVADGDPATGDFPVSGGEHFLPGRELTVLAGYHGAVEPIFTGPVLRQRVVVRRGSSWLEVECRDPAHRMTLGRRQRFFEDAADSDVAQILLDEHGLGADLTPTEVVHPVLQQFQASDWDFLISRLEAAGQLCAVEAGVVRSYVPTLDDEAEADVLFGATLLELDAEVDARPQVGTVRAQAWDPAGQDLAEAEAVEPTWPGPGDLSVDELTAATERTEELLWHGGALAPDALQAWADGRLLRSRLAGARGRARFQGLATVRPGMVLGLGGLGARFDGTVHVTGVRHELSQGDWTTDAEFGLDPEPHAARFPVGHLPAAGLAPPVRGLQVGVVSQLADDPAGEHRVRVQIPTAGLDDPGLWARIATLDAGDGRGTFFRPEVGDEVALGFFHDDPTQPVVLGMLHSSAKAPPLDAAEDNPQKAYVSREGLTLLFDDAEGILRLETPGGNRLTLSDADGGLTLEDQNGNRLEMGSDGIVLHSAKSLGLSAETDLGASGLEVNVDASTGFSAKGGATAEVTSDGPLTLQGAVVQIN